MLNNRSQGINYNRVFANQCVTFTPHPDIRDDMNRTCIAGTLKYLLSNRLISII